MHETKKKISKRKRTVMCQKPIAKWITINAVLLVAASRLLVFPTVIPGLKGK